MAAYRKQGSRWRAEVFKLGIRKSATRTTKAEAIAWATAVEAQILAGKQGSIPDKTFGDLLERYRDEVSVNKRGHRWERLRLDLIGRDPLAKVKLCDLSRVDFADWRDRRLKEVSAASVRREWGLMSHAVNTAINDWAWLKENALKGITKPAAPPPRDRRISNEELDALCLGLGWDGETPPMTATARVGAAMMFAIETAMRAGEIAGLTWDRVDLDARVARLDRTKNGSKREVPLSHEAVMILRVLQVDEIRALDAMATGTVFGLTVQQIDVLFRKGKARAMIEDLHFHDTRHEAITRLSKIFNVLQLARIVGHRDLKNLMIYYNETAADLAKLLTPIVPRPIHEREVSTSA